MKWSSVGWLFVTGKCDRKKETTVWRTLWVSSISLHWLKKYKTSEASYLAINILNKAGRFWCFDTASSVSLLFLLWVRYRRQKSFNNLNLPCHYALYQGYSVLWHHPKSNMPFRYHPNVSLFQYACRFSLMHFITTEKSIGSFQRIFFKNAFHQILRVASVANLSVKRARFSR